MRLAASLTAPERVRLVLFALAVVALHVLGIGLLYAYMGANPVVAGLGWTAYLFGLRHAFDADHISAIDNTTRKLVQDGERPLGAGFFFSLGHSTVVFGLAIGLAVATRAVGAGEPVISRYGGLVGTGMSGLFLLAIGVLNLLVLIDVVGIARRMRAGRYDSAALESRLLQRGLMNRFLGRFSRLVRASWQMYPLGILFGLGFDTASEIGLLAVAAGAATNTVPIAVVVALPVLFAAGMSLMDTLDGAFMMHAYGWAFSNPVRKVYYNITVTSISVAVALLVGSVELLQVLTRRLALSGGVWDWLGALDFELLGYAVVAVFLVMWGGSYVVWRGLRIEERWSGSALPPT